jgi:hypothetical protein
MKTRGRPKGSKGKTEDPPGYKVDLKCLGRHFTSEGDTVEEALAKIKISNGARALSVITLTGGALEKTRILSARTTNSIFGQASPSLRAIHFQKLKELLV